MAFPGNNLRDNSFMAPICEATPVAWARRWYIDGETPKKERNANGRLVWPKRFKFLPVTVTKVFDDDVPLGGRHRRVLGA